MQRPRVLDAEDGRMLARAVVLTVVVFWALLALGAALGLGVRIFFLAKGG